MENLRARHLHPQGRRPGTRKVDDLVKALGVDSGISKSEVNRICAELDAESPLPASMS
jgi:Transposase, Mutator family